MSVDYHIAFAAALTVAVAACSEPQISRDDEVVEHKPPAEIQVPPPAYPVDRDLVAFQLSGGSLHHFFVDSKSVSMGNDDIVRYTMVVRTAGGATSASYEGIRCATGEAKVYATGRSDRSWAPVRDPQWRRIVATDVNGYQSALAESFCSGKRPVASLAQALQRLKYPRALPTVD